MLVQNSYDYVQIGLGLRYLLNVSEHHLSSDVKEVEKGLMGQLKKAGFVVALQSTRSVRYTTALARVYELNDTDAIGKELASKISREAKTLEEIVFAESSTKQLYVLPSRRFNAEYLLYSPNKLLKDGAFDKLDEIAKQDLRSACKCLLFGEATASAFHMLRATESALKSYYLHHRRTKRLERPMWAGMIDQLEKKTRNRPPASLLVSLDVIRSAYRNPTQHPEASYHIDSAQDLFGVCLDVIGKMCEEL